MGLKTFSVFYRFILFCNVACFGASSIMTIKKDNKIFDIRLDDVRVGDNLLSFQKDGTLEFNEVNFVQMFR